MLPRVVSCLLPVVVALGLVNGCASGPNQRFVFTPVPYTDVGPSAGCLLCSSYIAMHDGGGEYFADQVILAFGADSIESISRFAESLGFRILATDTLSVKAVGFATMLVQVPPGGALAAREMFEKRFGVRFADLNEILHTDQATLSPAPASSKLP